MHGLHRLYRFYADGFRHLTWGRTLWLIVLLKLAFLLLVLRPFFFPSALAGLSEEEKQETVARRLAR